MMPTPSSSPAGPVAMPQTIDKKPSPNTPPAGRDPFSELVLPQRPEEDFWEKYNKRLEFPLSLVLAVLIHLAVMALLIYILVGLMNREDRSSVPVQPVYVSGLNEGGGSGSPGSGGIEDPFVRADAEPDKALVQSLPNPNQIPEIREEIRQTIKYFDDQGRLPISDSNAAAYASLEESIRKKLLGARQGTGDGPGSGIDGSGKGPGGSGADSTLGRNLRWVLRFRVSSGRDYLEQLKAMQAKILVPIPNTDKCVFYPDLNDLSRHRMATDDDLRVLANQIKFCDTRREAVIQVATTLGLDFRPNTFWAFFPKNLEDELARLERNYRNRRPEDIEETVFRVTFRGGKPEVVVEEQRLKR
ncbi:MAG: hypothetical protein NZ703_04935 [Gemmataceae bacterium]|nr:hypothetical protein [Gemmataceae bacterium]